jgi:hypothetical protein
MLDTHRCSDDVRHFQGILQYVPTTFIMLQGQKCLSATGVGELSLQTPVPLPTACVPSARQLSIAA